MTATTTPQTDADEHVLNAAGEFEVHDQRGRPVASTASRTGCRSRFFWVLALVIFYQFFTRYALNDSASWTEEIARYLLICVTWVGAAIATRKNNHMQVDFFYRLLPAPVTRVMSTLVDVVRIAFLGYACVLTVMLMEKIGGQPMAIIDWPIGLVYGVVLFGFALMTFRAVQVAIQNWRRKASVLEKPELMDGDSSRDCSAAASTNDGSNDEGETMGPAGFKLMFLGLMGAGRAGGHRHGGRLADLRDVQRQHPRLRGDPPHGQRRRLVPAARGAVLHPRRQPDELGRHHQPHLQLRARRWWAGSRAGWATSTSSARWCSPACRAPRSRTPRGWARSRSRR